MRTRSRTVRVATVGLGISLMLASCGSDKKDDKADSTTTTAAAGGTTTTTSGATAVAPGDNGGRKTGDGELVLGAVLPQTGNLAQLGPPMISGAEMAERDINAGGGVNGKPIRLIVKDDGGKANDALAASNADELINNDKVDGIVGAAATSTTQAIVDKVTSGGTVECSPSNTGTNLTKIDDKGLFFRTPPVDDLQAQALAKAISDDGRQNVAIIAQNSDYGTGFVDYLKPALEKNGAKVVADVTYEADGTGIDSEVTKAVASEPDSIVLIGYPEDGGKVLAELIKQGSGPADVPIYVTDGMQSNELYKTVNEKDPSVTEGIRGTAASAAPTNGASFFPAAFKEFATDVESPIYSAQSYDCVIIMALAAEKSGSDAPFDIAKELINVTKGETADAEKCDTYAKCVALLKEKKDINYEGASGSLDFNEWGEPSAGQYEVYTYLADGTYKVDETVDIGK